jgi:NSS family neurotransmitter:Na+ symporter
MAGRARFGSKLGLILSGVGSAVGLGNIWRFPQVTSSEGGAAFLFIYLPLVAFLSFPLILAEMSLGQKGQGSPFRTVKNVAGDKWGWVGGFLILATVLFMSYYTIIGGLTLKYAIFGAFQDALTNPEPFLAASNEGPSALLMHGVFTAIGVGIIAYGVSDGLEKANKIMMPALFVIVIALAIYAVFQDGAGAGIDYYLSPDFSAIGLNTIQVAIGQAFFSTSVGFGIMLTFGSYMESGQSLIRSAGTIAVMDTFVAFTAGLMIFPLVFSQGLADQVIGTESLTDALYLTMPTAFGQISTGLVGYVFLIGFFGMVTMGALSSSISGLEVITSFMEEQWDISRWKGALLAAELTFGLGIVSALNSTMLGNVDTIVGNVMLVGGGLLVAVLYGVAIDEPVKTLLGGEEDPGVWEERITRYVSYIIRYVIPLALAAILIGNIPGTIDSLTWPF